MKIYTKTGDKGDTSLANGERIHKHSPQIEAIGTVDELNSQIGLLLAQLVDDHHRSALTLLQNRLFNVGSELANAPQYPSTAADIIWLETQIDTMSQSLTPLQQFILPTGSLASAQAQVCRAVARRFERSLLRLHATQPQPDLLLQWTNRLSDYLFTLARTLNTNPETFWKDDRS